MGWAAISPRTTYEEASALASKYDYAMVSVGPVDSYGGVIDVSPIVARIPDGPIIRNYFENGQMRVTNSANPFHSYTAYYYVPSKIHYVDLLSYLYKHWRPNLEGVTRTVLLYLTEQKERFVYFSYTGLIHFQLTAYFDNPLLYFETGHWAPSSVDEKIANSRERDNEK